jgi:Zn-finger nucleic acid-binding protein
MNCPVCKTVTLSHSEVPEQLNFLECKTCKGRWLQSYKYWKWKDKQGKDVPEISSTETVEVPVNDSEHAKLCPECGHILIRFPVGHGIEFTLDHCGNCGGIWFDENEWEVLKNRNLHYEIHKIFSEVWQTGVRAEAHEKYLRNLYVDKFGKEDYGKIEEIKNWLERHPLKHELYAYLLEQK